MEYTYALNLSQSNHNGIYKTTDTVKFFPALRVSGNQQLAGKVNWTLFKHNFCKIDSGTIDLNTLGCCIEIKNPEAGQYRCKIEYTTGQGETVSSELGAVVSPETLRPAWQVPDDFDEFWNIQKARLAKISLNYKLSALKSKDIESFRVKVNCVDNTPVSGIYMRPEKAAKKSHPAIINFHGAGVKCSMPNDLIAFADKNFIALDINAHGIDDDREVDYYASLAENELADYRLRGFLENKKGNVYFLNMFLRAKRAIDFICDQDEWDGKNLVMYGGSQGGFQAIAAAYLDRRASALCAIVPAGTDIAAGGWPFCSTLQDYDAQQRENIKKCAPYFDNISFATRLDIPMFTMAGFVDMSCYAEGIFAFFNSYKGSDKQIIHCASMPHTPTESFIEDMKSFVYARLKQ